MAGVLTVQQICEEALRDIGSFAINDASARPRELHVAARRLDLVVSHTVSVYRLFHLLQPRVTLPLLGNTATYKLKDLLGQGFPADGLQYIVEATITGSAGGGLSGVQDQPLEFVDAHQYELIQLKAQAGIPEKIYVDRLVNSSLTIWPVPAVNDPLGGQQSGLVLNLRIVAFSPDMSKAVPNPDKLATAQQQHGFRPGWQLWMIKATARQCGGGAVRRLADAEVKALGEEADALLHELLSGFDNDEKPKPRRVLYPQADF